MTLNFLRRFGQILGKTGSKKQIVIPLCGKLIHCAHFELGFNILSRLKPFLLKFDNFIDHRIVKVHIPLGYYSPIWKHSTASSTTFPRSAISATQPSKTSRHYLLIWIWLLVTRKGSSRWLIVVEHHWLNICVVVLLHLESLFLEKSAVIQISWRLFLGGVKVRQIGPILIQICLLLVFEFS